MVGLLGWLAVSALHLTGESVFFIAFLVGAVAGTLTRQPTAILGLVAGVVAAYPLAMALGFIVFLGDNWAIYAAIASALAAAGFVAAVLAGARHGPVAEGDAPGGAVT